MYLESSLNEAEEGRNPIFTFDCQVLHLWRYRQRGVRSCNSVWLPGDRQLPVSGNGRGNIHRQLCRWWKWLQTNVSIWLFILIVLKDAWWSKISCKENTFFRISRSLGRAGRVRGRMRSSRALAKRKGRRRVRRLQKEEQEKERSKVVKEKVLEERRRRVRRLKPQWGFCSVQSESARASVLVF